MQQAHNITINTNSVNEYPADTSKTDCKPKLLDCLRETFALIIAVAAQSRPIVIGLSGSSSSTNFVTLQKWLIRIRRYDNRGNKMRTKTTEYDYGKCEICNTLMQEKLIK